MKNKILTLILLLATSPILFSQVSGDYRTASGGEPWDELIPGFGGNIDWETYNGSAWVTTTYPTSIDHTVYINHPGITIMSNTITINSGGKIIIAADADLYDAGKIVNNGNGIEVKADASGVGQYKNKTDIQVSLQYYLSASSWHLIGSPFSGYSTETLFTGAYMQQFDDADADNWVWNDEAGFTSSMTVGHGYSYWKSSSATYTFSGTADADDKTLSSLPNVGDGYILLANPYICAVKYTADWARTNITDGLDLWGVFGGSYAHYEASDGQPIPTGSGFFMKTTGTANLTIEADNRITTTTSNPFKQGSDNPQEYARLVIKNINNDMADMLKFKVEENSSSYFNETDGEKMFGTEESPDFFMLTEDDIAVAIKGIEATQASTIKLQLRPNVDATYKITATAFTFDPNTEVLLEDLFTSTIMTIDETLDYTFTSLATDIEDRFRIYVTPTASNIDQPTLEDQFKIFGSNYQLRILSDENNYKVKVYNLLGQKLIEKNNIQGNLELDLNAYKQKIVIVSIQTENEIISKKIQLR